MTEIVAMGSIDTTTVFHTDLNYLPGGKKSTSIVPFCRTLLLDVHKSVTLLTE